MKASVPFSTLRERALQNPELAKLYIEEFLEEGDEELLQQALEQVAKANQTQKPKLRHRLRIGFTSGKRLVTTAPSKPFASEQWHVRKQRTDGPTLGRHKTDSPAKKEKTTK